MPTALTVILLLAAVLGTLALALQLLLVRRHLQEEPKTPSAWPGISVLEPRCGVDDELEQTSPASPRWTTRVTRSCWA